MSRRDQLRDPYAPLISPAVTQLRGCPPERWAPFTDAINRAKDAKGWDVTQLALESGVGYGPAHRVCNVYQPVLWPTFLALTAAVGLRVALVDGAGQIQAVLE